MYALSLNTDNRILSAWVVLPIGNYDGMPIVDTFPEGDMSDYLYIDGEYVYDPLPKPPEPTPSGTGDVSYDEPLGTFGMYMKGECCTDGGKTYVSTIDNNVWKPSEYPAGWIEY